MKDTYKEALKRASFCLRQAGLKNPRAEAELLLASVLDVDRLKLITSLNEEFDPSKGRKFEAALKRRASLEPLAYITGEKFFFGRRFHVSPEVLIPRPETELIIEEAILRVDSVRKKSSENLTILDLGTGCGNLAITLALELPDADLYAVDVSSAALEIAFLNAREHDVENRIKFLQGSYFEALEKQQEELCFNLVVSNPPYISLREMERLPASVGSFEPQEALDGGEDGLDGYRHILNDLACHVEEPALLLVEIGSEQRAAVTELFRKSGLFRMIGCRPDLAGHPRVMIGLI